MTYNNNMAIYKRYFDGKRQNVKESRGKYDGEKEVNSSQRLKETFLATAERVTERLAFAHLSNKHYMITNHTENIQNIINVR